MPDNNFLDAFSQTETNREFQQPEAISRLKTPNDFRGGLFNRPDVNSVQAAQAFRSAIEAGDLGVTQQFIDAGIIDNLHQADAQKAFEMIEKVKDVQGRFTPKGIERFGGMRRILREGLPGEQKPQTIQTPKGPQQKLTKAPSQEDMFFQEFSAATTPEEQNEILDRFSRFQKAKKGESPFEVEKAEKKLTTQPEPTQAGRASKRLRQIGKLRTVPGQEEEVRALPPSLKAEEKLARRVSRGLAPEKQEKTLKRIRQEAEAKRAPGKPEFTKASAFKEKTRILGIKDKINTGEIIKAKDMENLSPFLQAYLAVKAKGKPDEKIRAELNSVIDEYVSLLDSFLSPGTKKILRDAEMSRILNLPEVGGDPDKALRKAKEEGFDVPER